MDQLNLEQRYLRVEDAARYCQLSTSLLNRLRHTGGGPRYTKISSRVVYRIYDLDEWLDAHQRSSTSEAVAGIWRAS